MQLADFDFALPDELIAQEPAARREDSRMLVVGRSASSIRDDQFRNFSGRLNRGDVLVLNNTRVFPARIFGISESGAKAEIFLIRKAGDDVWEALARPARRLKQGKRIHFGDELTGTIERHLPDGHVEIQFSYAGVFDEVLERIGKTPLPPYIKRPADDADHDRYQTVFARSPGAIAAPTAGLHFTPEVLDEIKNRDVEIVEITLHVGYGTFEPVRATDLSHHSVLPERYVISDAASVALNGARSAGRRIVAVGTTTTRTLESVIGAHGEFMSGSGVADLTITPGYRFQAIDALLTNFHLPQSSLLILVSTFGGHELIIRAYEHAVAERYRFYSYGDCMFIDR